MLKGFVRVERTNAGNTGIGLEVQVAGMKKYGDLTKAQQDFFKKNGFRWMKADYKEQDGNWVKVREGFFYKSFKTKKERDEMAKKFETKLVKPETKKAEKKTAKKAEPKKAEPKKDLSKMTKKELLDLIATLTA